MGNISILFFRHLNLEDFRLGNEGAEHQWGGLARD